MTASTKNSSHDTHRRNLIIVFLIVVLLIGSLFVYLFVVNNESYVGSKHVSNETELNNAISKAKNDTPMTIILDNSISLSYTINIPAYKNIILTSNSETEFFKLIGVNDACTLNVAAYGELTLDGICVTHIEGAVGSGIMNNFRGTLIMYDGEISGNKAQNYGNTGYSYGGGVNNQGTFMMYGGVISDNTASNGGGVYVFSSSIFEVSGGEITGNTAEHGGGVYNSGGLISISDCVITNNIAISDGGGVCNSGGTVNMFNGKISNNKAQWGGGVWTSDVFKMLGGEISGNTATERGGGVYNDHIFERTDGEIFGNTATYEDENVYNNR